MFSFLFVVYLLQKFQKASADIFTELTLEEPKAWFKSINFSRLTRLLLGLIL